MTLRRRPRARQVIEVSSEARTAAQYHLDAWEKHCGGPEAGRAAWAAIGHAIVRPGPHRPAAWWAYTPDVPDGLRVAVEAPDARVLLVEGAPRDTYEAGHRRWREHQIARYEWLIASGHLEADELEAARSRARLLTEDLAG